MGLIQGVYSAGRRLWNVLGASAHQMTICTIAGGVGTGFTLGRNKVGMDPETLSQAKLIILWGTNTLSTNHHLWRVILTARAAGALVVAIDPVRTRTAAAADLHLAPIPGTDAALALGLLHVVLAEGAEDREFIAQHTLGWAAFRARILDYPPERVAAITGLPVEAIVDLGQRVARSRPTGIRLAMGLQRHGGGGMAVRAITCIPGVTGDWRYPGGGAVYDTRDFFPGDWAALWRDDLRPAGTRALSMTRLGEGLLEVSDPPSGAIITPATSQRAPQTRSGAAWPATICSRGDRAFPNRHRGVRRYRAAGHHAVRTRRPAHRLRPPVCRLERTGRGPTGRMPPSHRDLSAPGPAAGSDRAVPLRER
jgi:hypothetical protein